uniref:Uncharacterized protein n=1 Tax=Arundo donax TaxID=35708 RepID=A0A0A9HUZ2_ARUDO
MMTVCHFWVSLSRNHALQLGVGGIDEKEISYGEKTVNYLHISQRVHERHVNKAMIAI